MTDILVIAPPGNISQKIFCMNEIGGIAGILRREKIRYAIIDCDGTVNDLRLLRSYADRKPACIAIVLQWERNIKNNPWLRILVDNIRRRFPETHLNCLGRAATIFYRQLLQANLCDSVIRGETEFTFTAFYNRLTDVDHWQATKGLAYKDGEQIITTPKRIAISDLDALPQANRDYLQNRRNYPIAPLYSSRSCHGKCVFCFGRIFRQANPRTSKESKVRSPESIVAEIEHIINHYGTKSFYFVDDNFLPDHEFGVARANKIVALILKRGLKIRFSIECRADDIKEETFQLLKKAGLQKVFVGFESGSDAVLRRYRKGTTVAINLEAVNTLRKLGISIDPGFIMFDPWTSFEELIENLEFIKNSQINQCKSLYSLFNPLSILPGSEIEKKYEAQGGRTQDARVNAVKRVLTHTDRLVHRFGLTSVKNRMIPAGSGLFEDKRRDLLFQVFREVMSFLKHRSPSDLRSGQTELEARVDRILVPQLGMDPSVLES